MEEFDILGFDPSQLAVFDQTNAPKGDFNSNVYKPKPEKSISEDHVYRSVIKPIYNPFDIRHSVVEQQAYAIHDSKGWLTVVSTLTNNDTSCPIFKAWKKCRYAEPGSVLWKQQAKKEEGGKNLFDKRFSRYILIQVLEDANQPDLVGKYMFWKTPKFIWEMINNKMKPTAESKRAAVPVMDFLFGKAIELEVTPGEGKPGDESYGRDTSYSASQLTEDVMSCTNPDGSSLLTDDQQDILDTYVATVKKIWREKDPEKRVAMNAELNADPNTKEFKSFYKSIVEKIKGFCPDLVKEMGYNPWSEEVTARVNSWIELVLDGKDPAAQAPAADVVSAVNSLNTKPASTPTEEIPVNDGDDEDLPF